MGSDLHTGLRPGSAPGQGDNAEFSSSKKLERVRTAAGGTGIMRAGKGSLVVLGMRSSGGMSIRRGAKW